MWYVNYPLLGDLNEGGTYVLYVSQRTLVWPYCVHTYICTYIRTCILLRVLLQESTSSELGAVCVSERHSQVISQQKQTIKDLRQKLKDLKESKPPSELYTGIMYVRMYLQYIFMYICTYVHT